MLKDEANRRLGLFGEYDGAALQELIGMAKAYVCNERRDNGVPDGRFSDFDVAFWEMLVNLARWTPNCERDYSGATLFDITNLEVNNESCVILRVKKNCEAKLIALGCFDGDEIMFRLTKGQDVTCTVFREGNKSYSWEWGLNGRTIVSN